MKPVSTPSNIWTQKHSSLNVWLPDAGPSVELLSAYNDGLVKWDEFETCYRQEQESLTYCRVVTYSSERMVSDAWVPLSPMQLLRDLEQQHGTVTVMCRERAGEHCHRYIVVQSAKEKNMEWKIACNHCHETYSVHLRTRKLLMAYCTVECATAHGMPQQEADRLLATVIEYGCESCKRPYSTDIASYCVPTQTQYGVLCHRCREENKQDIKLGLAPSQVSDEIRRQWGAANQADWARMMREYFSA
jgi:uncharacterized protein YeaO (DUF488 family)